METAISASYFQLSPTFLSFIYSQTDCIVPSHKEDAVSSYDQKQSHSPKYDTELASWRSHNREEAVPDV